MGCVLGLDTSNYTTSAAWFDGETGENAGKLLEVPQGSLGCAKVRPYSNT